MSSGTLRASEIDKAYTPSESSYGCTRETPSRDDEKELNPLLTKTCSRGLTSSASYIPYVFYYSRPLRIDQRHLGGYSVGDPPLTIPNREVKPNSADGTCTQGE